MPWIKLVDQYQVRERERETYQCDSKLRRTRNPLQVFTAVLNVTNRTNEGDPDRIKPFFSASPRMSDAKFSVLSALLFITLLAAGCQY